MRAAAGLLTVLYTGGLSQVLAAEPQSPSPAPVAPTEQQSEAAPTAEKSTATPAKPAVTVIGTKPELTPEEKELISRGYKFEMRHGEKYFCRVETQVGSRFPLKSCDTAQSIQSHRASGQEALRVITNDRSWVNK
jgi:hypothetical protein